MAGNQPAVVLLNGINYRLGAERNVKRRGGYSYRICAIYH